MCITVRLSESALRFLREKAPGRTGKGAFLSALLMAQEAREEIRAALAQKPAKPVSSKQSWASSGINVD